MMPIDFVIGLSLVVVVATVLGMGFAVRYAMKHIEQDAQKAKNGQL